MLVLHALRPGGLALLAAMLLALLACAGPAWATNADVLVVGDSLAVGTEPYLGPMLGGHTLLNDVRNGITTPQGMRLLRISLQTMSPKIVVVSLGTNDGGDPRRFADRVRRTMSYLPLDTCVVWSTIFRPRRKGPYRPLNRVLHRLKKLDPRLVVIDWEHAVTGGSVFLPDGLHADPDGYRYRSAMIANAVNGRCPAAVDGG